MTQVDPPAAIHDAGLSPPPTAKPWQTWSDDEHLYAFAVDRNVLCPLCYYNLRGLTSPTCPECGQPLKLRVALAEPYLAPWLTLFINLCLAAGPGIFVIIAFVIAGLPRVPRQIPDIDQWLAWFSLVYLVASVPLMALTLALRRRLCRLPYRDQWTLAAIPLTANVVVIIWFVTLHF